MDEQGIAGLGQMATGFSPQGIANSFNVVKSLLVETHLKILSRVFQALLSGIRLLAIGRRKRN